jgi:hypothetical protein
MSKYIITRKELAEILGYDEKYINQLVDEKGLPRLQFNQYDLIEVVKWWKNYIEELHREELKRVRAFKPQDELALKSARLKELEILEREGKLIEVDLVRSAWLEEIKLLKELLDSLGARLSHNLIGKDVKEIKRIIDEEVERIEQNISELPIENEEDDID